MTTVGGKPRPRRVDLRAEPEDDEGDAPLPPPATKASAPPARPADADADAGHELVELRAELAMARVEIASLQQKQREPAPGAPADALERETEARVKAEKQAAASAGALESARLELEVAQRALADARASHAREVEDLKAQVETLRAAAAVTPPPAATPAPAKPEPPRSSAVPPPTTSKRHVDITPLLEASRTQKPALGGLPPGLVKALVLVTIGLLVFAARGEILHFIHGAREAPQAYATKMALGNLAGMVHTETNGGHPMRREELDKLLDDLAKKNPSAAKDAWGTRFRLDETPYELRSAGPDMQLDTEDDLVLPLTSGATE